MFKKIINYFKLSKKYNDLLEKYKTLEFECNSLKMKCKYGYDAIEELRKENKQLTHENNNYYTEYKKICYEFKEESFRKQIYPSLEGMKYILTRFNIESGDIDYCLLKNVINETYRVLVKAKNQFGFDKEFHLCKEEFELFFKEE
ncbi:MAG: hypothetical protein JW924_12325 [Fusobacteriaceae bacterium]|nr:hypothetical protein [Fusobacteriaceae bacterium]